MLIILIYANVGAHTGSPLLPWVVGRHLWILPTMPPINYLLQQYIPHNGQSPIKPWFYNISIHFLLSTSGCQFTVSTPVLQIQPSHILPAIVWPEISSKDRRRMHQQETGGEDIWPAPPKLVPWGGDKSSHEQTTSKKWAWKECHWNKHSEVSIC